VEDFRKWLGRVVVDFLRSPRYVLLFKNPLDNELSLNQLLILLRAIIITVTLSLVFKSFIALFANLFAIFLKFYVLVLS
jgi:hypothetical protein